MANAEAIAGMTATLCSYEKFFGPGHPQTLLLTVALALEYRRAGESNVARRLLEKAIADSVRHPAAGPIARQAAQEVLAIEAPSCPRSIS